MGLDTVEFVLDVEEAFSIKLQDNEVSKTETVEQFCRLVRNKCLQKDSFKVSSYSSIYNEIVQILHFEFSIELDVIQADSRFVQD